MSYANGTTHYNLPQTVGTDKRDWFDTNEAFADVDEALYGAVEASASAASGVTALGTRVGTVESDVADLKSSRTTDEARISALETLGAQHTTDIADVKADALDMICAVDEGSAQVASVAVEAGKYFRYNDVLYMATVNIAIGDTIVPNTNCRATNVATELESISPSGEVIDVTARQGVATNASHIGTLANLQTTEKGNLVAAINEVLSQIGGGSMPELDFANAIRITTSGDTTVSANGALIYCMAQAQSISCDGTVIAHIGTGQISSTIQFIPAGTVINLSATPTSSECYAFVPYKAQ